MRFLLLIFFALAAGIGLTVFVDNPGYVLITREPWSLETSLTLFVLGLLIAFFSFYLLIRLLKNLFATPKNVRRWQVRRHREHAIEDTRKGLLETISGNCDQAEKLLTRSLGDSPQAEINLLAAAWIAQQKDEQQKRDDYLAKASNLVDSTAGDAEIAVGLTHCILKEKAGQIEQALASARALHESTPANSAVTKCLIRLLRDTGQWQKLLPVLLTAKRHHVLSESEQASMETQAAAELLTSSKDISDLDEYWKKLSKKAHKDPAVIASYCASLRKFGKSNKAESLIRSTLKHQWSEELVEIYGLLETTDPGSQLKQAESWLTEHPTNTVLMLCMGRLAIQNKLWGMARSFLDVAVQNGDSNEAFLELAQLLESLNENDAALKVYRRGLEQSLGSHQADFIISANSRIKPESSADKVSDSQGDKLQQSDTSAENQAPSLAYSNESK